MRMLATIIAATLLVVAGESAAAATEKPNVIYIMSDELGYYEPGFMGGKNIHTPNLDRMAAEGIRFNNLFAGSSVCAPTRCCFLTGKHSGHTSVRLNGGGRAASPITSVTSPTCCPPSPRSPARRLHPISTESVWYRS